ncbi:hypothetical protein EDD85DRAFT_942923 [Armillaria nabsnona]|nr:hypothetical protein EDD85DRAFT_942923 [Armillaria nabsnona]
MCAWGMEQKFSVKTRTERVKYIRGVWRGSLGYCKEVIGVERRVELTMTPPQLGPQVVYLLPGAGDEDDARCTEFHEDGGVKSMELKEQLGKNAYTHRLEIAVIWVFGLYHTEGYALRLQMIYPSPHPTSSRLELDLEIRCSASCETALARQSRVGVGVRRSGTREKESTNEKGRKVRERVMPRKPGSTEHRRIPGEYGTLAKDRASPPTQRIGTSGIESMAESDVPILPFSTGRLIIYTGSDLDALCSVSGFLGGKICKHQLSIVFTKNTQVPILFRLLIGSSSISPHERFNIQQWVPLN